MECTPRARVAAEHEAAGQAASAARVRSAGDLAQRHAHAERLSLEDPDRPERLHPDGLPETITLRVITQAIPGALLAELPSGESTSMDVHTQEPDAAMAGAEAVLAALGYTLDRYRLYSDMSLMVGKFHLKEGPYDG